MITPLFKPALAPPEIFSTPTPWTVANKLFIDNIEKLISFQIHALRSCCDISINQIRAVAEINDPTSLWDFYVCQAEIARNIRRKLLNDARLLADLGLRFKHETDALTQLTLEDLWGQAA